MHLQRSFEIAIAALAATAVAVAVVTAEGPVPLSIAAFVLVIVAAENTAILLPSSTSISPSLLVIFAAIATFEPGTASISAAIVGASAGVVVETIRGRRWGVLLLNTSQYVIASTAAAAAFHATDEGGTSSLVASLVAVLAFTAIQYGIVLPGVAILHRVRLREVWSDLGPSLPNYVAFGLVGVLVGMVCKEAGAEAIVLLVMPVVVSRLAFASFKRSNDSQEAAIRIFGRLIEAKDPYTAGHTMRVAGYTGYIAEEFGLSTGETAHLRHSALMHDVGKLAVPSRLLNKPGRLTADEWEVVRAHNDAGIGILNRVDFMRSMAVTASDRHGHYARGADEGTPGNLVREAHIVAVADAFDAMTSTRSYRRALSQEVAFAELRDKAGEQFSPSCVEALIAAIERRGERYGAGHEVDAHQFAVAPPEAGVGSAGLGDLAEGAP